MESARSSYRRWRLLYYSVYLWNNNLPARQKGPDLAAIYEPIELGFKPITFSGELFPATPLKLPKVDDGFYNTIAPRGKQVFYTWRDDGDSKDFDLLVSGGILSITVASLRLCKSVCLPMPTRSLTNRLLMMTMWSLMAWSVRSVCTLHSRVCIVLRFYRPVIAPWLRCRTHTCR